MMKSALKTLPLLALATLLTVGTSLAAGSDLWAGWSVDYKAAQAQAKKENKPLLVLFTGSDWCPPCMQMEKDTFSKPAFAQFADKNLVRFVADQPMKTQLPPGQVKQNEALSQQYKVDGVPTVILFSPQGKELARNVGYIAGGVPAFEDWVNSAK
jgi:thioredoxin-related protein